MRGTLAAASCAILLALGAGCGGSGTADGPGEAVENPAVGIDPAAPAEEDPDLREEADQPGSEAVALEVPGLPVGGGSTVVSATLQCVDVGWSGPDIPGGIRIGFTQASFMPPDGFTASTQRCPGVARRCLGEGFWITSAGERCLQAVAWTGRPTIDEQRMLAFDVGAVVCLRERLDECREFVRAVLANGPETIPLEPGPSEDETSADDTGTSTRGNDDQGSDQTDPGEPGAGTPDPTPGEPQDGPTGSGG